MLLIDKWGRGTYCCICMATLNTFILLTATSTSATIKIECTVAFPWQQWFTNASQCNVVYTLFILLFDSFRRSQWPRGLRRRSSADRLLRLWVRNPPGAWMFVCLSVVSCVLSGRGLCDGLITRPEVFYRLWRVIKTNA